MTQENPQPVSIFRTNAISHLSAINNPQLSLSVINPSAWLWVSAAAFFLSGLFLWAIFGRISITVPASGIILPENGQVIPIIATQQGHVSEVYVKEGTSVQENTVLARLANPYMDEDLKYLQKVYEDHEKLLNQFKAHALQKKAVLSEHFHQQEKILQESLKDHQEKLNTLKDLLVKKRALFKKHYLTMPEMTQAKEEVIIAKKELAKVKSDLELAPIQFKEENDALDEKTNLQLAKVLESQHALEKKMLEKKNGAVILSPGKGLITAHHISKGDYVTGNKTLFTLVTSHTNPSLETLVFIKHSEGKKVGVGMKAYILPSNISAYEYGYIKGKIIEISEYPASKEAVYPYLGNTALVDEFFGSGAPFLAKIQLEKSNLNPSGFAWTTQKGTPFKIKPGSTVSVKLITKEISPLKLLTSRAAGAG